MESVIQPEALHIENEASGRGEMWTRVREKDWSSTPLGDRAIWPKNLELCVQIILASGFPMAIRWGPNLVTIYNDGFRRILGDKHPGALGRPLREVWPEVYDQMGRLHEEILRGERRAFFAEDQQWMVQGHGGRPEKASLTIGYSPIPDPGAPPGNWRCFEYRF